jgi:uncharacterized membrane protein
MTYVNNLLLWAHLLGLGVGMAGGMGMGQIGPRLAAATPDQRANLWSLMGVFDRFAMIGVAVLVVTGPILVFTKFEGGHGLNTWFMVKMGLVLVFLILIGISHMGKARLKKGDVGGAKLMQIAGPLTMLSVLAIVFTAVMAFN